MGLTSSSTGFRAASESSPGQLKRGENDRVIALAGNPNVGKSTLFNSLTGLNQHTGNWTGKTVSTAAGRADGWPLVLVDLPGTYSLRAHSPEEVVARDFILSGEADDVAVVADACCLERGLALTMQILELTPCVVLCVNLMDEAARRGISVDLALLSERLGIPAVGVSAGRGDGLDELCTVLSTRKGSSPHRLIYAPETEEALQSLEAAGLSRAAAIDRLTSDDSPAHIREDILARPIIAAEGLALDVVRSDASPGSSVQGYSALDRKIDAIVTNRWLAVPLMLLLLAGIFWLTIVGSNYPSAALQSLFERLEAALYAGAVSIGVPLWLRELLLCGVLRTLLRVVAVMLPPMAIFFPLFTLMEDLGLMGRIAFNLDGAFKRCSACGKQALTMCMGLGCNAAGVVGCRIIDSPRERRIAVLTNSFMPCNGRFPILITMAALCCGAAETSSLAAAGIMTLLLLLGVIATLGVSKLLSVTILRGEPSSFTLELPPYRKPKIGQLIVRSVFDRTLYVLGRAAAVAAPAGLVIWLLANIRAGDMSLLSHAAAFFDPAGRLIGLDGVVICAFLLGFPANEIVLPLILMGYSAASGGFMSLGSDVGLAEQLAANGWSTLSFINMMLLTLFHFPCSTTILTIHRESGSLRDTLMAAAIPTVLGYGLCVITTMIWNILI